MNILLFGAPGSGKGTQSALLVEKLGYHQISTGDLFREAIKKKTKLGTLAQSYIDKGALVPDDVTLQLVEEAIAQLNGKKFILDGFPRNLSQANALSKLLEEKHIKLEKAFFLEVDSSELLSRLSGRRVCKSCGAVYHIKSKPTLKVGLCDACGGEVIQRNDDKPEVIQTRLATYTENTFPLKAYFKDKGIFNEVNGENEPGVVFESIRKGLK